MTEDKVDIIFGGAFSIKGYYEESNNPKQMRGASALLEKIFNDDIADILKECDSEAVYSSIGGELFAALKAGEGENAVCKIKEKIEKLFDKKCQTAQYAFICEEKATTLKELEDKDCYRKLKSSLHAKMDAERYNRFPDIVAMNATGSKSDGLDKDYIKPLTPEWIDYYQPFIKDKKTGRNIKPDGIEVCETCRLRPPHWFAEVEGKHSRGEPELLDVLVLCTSCAKKEVAGRVSREDDENKTQKFRYTGDTDITRFDELAYNGGDSGGNIALLYADINSLGEAGKNMAPFSKDKDFHEKVDRHVEAAVSATLDELRKAQGEDKGLYQVVSCAGDDVCILIPGEYALVTATTLARKFDEGLCDTTYISNLHISVGVAVAPSHTAIEYFHDMVDQLLKSAKKFYHALPDGEKKSCVDVYTIGGDGQTMTTLDDKIHPERSLRSEQGFQSLFPMTVGDANKFITLLNRRTVSPSQLRNLADAYRTMDVEIEADLFYAYTLARVQKEKNENDKSVSRALEIINSFGEARHTPPWHDMVAFRNQKTDWGESNA